MKEGYPPVQRLGLMKIGFLSKKHIEAVRAFLKKYIKITRTFFLILFACTGIYLAKWTHSYFSCVLPEEEYRLKTSLVMLSLSLPTVFLLWLFRTHDVEEQIKKAQENNEFNNFANAMRLFVEKDNMEANAIGFKLLIKLKHQGLYNDEIDLSTRYKSLYEADLKEAELREADLHGADLRKTNLQRVKLQKADLSLTKLQEADLQEAKLQEAKLQEVKLQEAKLQKAELQKAKLQGARLYGAELQGAKLQGAKLDGVILSGQVNNKTNLNKKELEEVMSLGGYCDGEKVYMDTFTHRIPRGSKIWADLRGAVLSGADLQKTDLEEAKLEGANLKEVDLQEVILRGVYLLEAVLCKADLRGANLQGAVLRKTDLRGAKLQEAKLQGADLRGAKLQEAKLQGAEYYDDTIFSDGFHPEKNGMIKKPYSPPPP